MTAEHLRTGKEYDAALLWNEDTTQNSFKACLREMQNFDGKHEDIYVVCTKIFDSKMAILKKARPWVHNTLLT